MRTVGSATQATYRDRYVALPKSRVIQIVLGTAWEIRVHFVSNEENFPYILQKHIKPGVLIDGYSVRLADGKIIDDDKPNKHYICSEKVWAYKNTNINYLRAMLKEQAEMGLIEEDL